MNLIGVQLVKNKKKKRIESFFKVRRIKTTYSTDRGFIFTEKNLNDGFIEFESLLEKSFFQLLIHDPYYVDIESQPVKIPCEKNKNIYYVPDGWAKSIEEKQFIFDVKHQDFLDSLQKRPIKAKKWELRLRSIGKFCEANELIYNMVTNNEIWKSRYENVNFFEKNKIAPYELPRIKHKIEEILNDKKSLSRIELAIQISKDINLDVKQVIPSIDHLIYHNYFLLDFIKKIDDNTILQIKSNHNSKLIPLNQYFSYLKEKNTNKFSKKSSVIVKNEKDPNYDVISRREFLALSEETRKKILKRTELLKIFEEDNLNTSRLIEFCKNNGISTATLYRWKNKFQELGWQGLIPNYERAGRKKSLSPELEKLMEEIIEDKFLNNSQPPITSGYDFLIIECEKRGIVPPHYDTFRLRVQKISKIYSAKKRRGNKVARDKYKLLEGMEHPFGKYPLEAVEFDHTKLDIILVDRIERKPLGGRPTLTLAIDVFSRMVYGYYLSLKTQDTTAVGICFLTGILPKDNITKYFGTKNTWNIKGLPKNIILDNAREFKSKDLLRFCKFYGIEAIYNPVRRPEFKPHVERLIKTINKGIQKDLIGGYTHTIEERRKTGINPEIKAELTIEEFDKWLCHWIVDYYHQRIHLGLKQKIGIEITPAKRYLEGLEECEGRMVGLPSVPLDQERILFDLLPSKERVINRGGIKIFNLEYFDIVITNIISRQNSEDTRYIIKYDPRDIREIYLWDENLKKYHKIPIKNVYMKQLMINPTDPHDYPLSKNELKKIKNKMNRRFFQRELAERKERRQEIIKNGRNKTNQAKKLRTRRENMFFNIAKSTATKIRKEDNKIPLKYEDKIKELKNKEKNQISEEWLEKNAFPIKLRWKKGDF